MNKKRMRNFIFVGLVALIVCGNFLTALAVETYTWEEKASMLYPRYRHALVATEDSIFALGGYDAAPTNPANRVEKYNLNTNTWEAKASMNYGALYCAASYYNGKIYLFGGTIPSIGGTNRAEVYDISTDSWSPLPAMPRIRYNGKSVVVNDKIYILGGEDGLTGTLSEVDVYSPSSNTWETVTNLPNKRNQGLFEVLGNKIYSFGGVSSSQVVDVYDTVEGTWSTAAFIPDSKLWKGHMSALVSGKIYSISSNNTHVYDPNTDQWSLVNSFFDIGAYEEGRTTVIGSKIYVSGGRYSTQYRYPLIEIAIISSIDAPTNLSAIPGNAQVLLNWDSVVGADSYTVKRATTAGGPYTSIAESITETSFLDTTVVIGTTYYYVVTSVNTAGESDPSNEASATPIAPVVNRALLNISMQDSLIKEYDLSMTQVNNFIDWYNSSTGSELYTVDKTANIGPFLSRKDYLVKGKIIFFEVMEFVNIE